VRSLSADCFAIACRATDGKLTEKDLATPFGPKRIKARAIDWDQIQADFHQGARLSRRISDVVDIAAADQMSKLNNPLATQEPSIHGPSPMARGKELTDRLFGLRKRAATGKHDFDTLCAALDIEHRLTSPRSPQTNGMVERFNGRIEDVLQSHHFRSGEELEATLDRYVWLYNQQLPQSALGSKTPLQAMKDWHKLKPELFKRQPYYRPGCDIGEYPTSLFYPAHLKIREK
jgi:hypothetical protein